MNIKKYHTMFSRLHKSYARKLWKHFLDKLTTFYVQLFLFSSLNYKPKQKGKFAKKIRRDRELMENVFKGEVITETDYRDMNLKLVFLAETLTKHFSSLKFCILDLAKVMKAKFFDEKSIKCILRLRTGMKKPDKEDLLAFLRPRLKVLKQNEAHEVRRVFKSTFMAEQVVRRYCRIIRNRIKKRKEEAAALSQSVLDEKLLQMKAEEKLVLERQAFILRSFMGIYETEQKNTEKMTEILSGIEEFKYTKMHFSFLDDWLVWKKSPTSKVYERKIGLAHIEKYGICGNDYLWFTKDQKMFILKAESEKERNDWIKSIAFLRDEWKFEAKPIDFEEFTCCLPKEDKKRSEPIKVIREDYSYERLIFAPFIDKDLAKNPLNKFQIEEEDFEVKELNSVELSSTSNDNTSNSELSDDQTGKKRSNNIQITQPDFSAKRTQRGPEAININIQPPEMDDSRSNTGRNKRRVRRNRRQKKRARFNLNDLDYDEGSQRPDASDNHLNPITDRSGINESQMRSKSRERSFNKRPSNHLGVDLSLDIDKVLQRVASRTPTKRSKRSTRVDRSQRKKVSYTQRNKNNYQYSDKAGIEEYIQQMRRDLRMDSPEISETRKRTPKKEKVSPSAYNLKRKNTDEILLNAKKLLGIQEKEG